MIGLAQNMKKAANRVGKLLLKQCSNVCNTNNVPTETTQTPSTDLGGYGAYAIMTYYENGKFNKVYYYSDYITVLNSEDIRNIFVSNSSRHYIHYVDGEKVFDWDVALSNISHGFSERQTNCSVQYFGDVRYEDGTKAPTDDEFITGTIKKFDDMTEKDLEDLLNDFAEEAERQNPDLSSLEGLLNAIYARLGSLDSDNDNQLLSEILTAICGITAFQEIKLKVNFQKGVVLLCC